MNTTDARGTTALLLAAESGSTASLQVLLAGGADPNVVDASGRTPLCAAAVAAVGDGRSGSVQQLLEAGACPAIALEALSVAGKAALPAVACLVAHIPLSVREWKMVPADCPGLGAALPAVMARCEWEAACLVQKLPAATRGFLWVAALSLARAQRHLDVALPSHIVSTVLALCAA